MSSLHIPPPAGNVLSDDSASPSNSNYIPASSDARGYEHDHEDEEYSARKSGKAPLENLRLQTDFGDDAEAGGPTSEDEANRYDSDEDLEGKTTRPGDGPKYTLEEEQEVVALFDRRLVPFLALLYLLAFLDRSNIGNAKIAGLQDDLNLSSSQYEWLLTSFYITYILFEWMTLMYRLVPPHIYISLCVCGWGLVASFQCLATSFWGLIVLRALLGITEAAFGPGVPFYLSLFYKRDELAFRNGLFISAAPLATSFASTLAWVIVKLSGNGPISPWRILFLVEGFPSVIVAIFAWILIPDSPGRARFLTRRQRIIARLRLEDKKSDFQHSPEQRFNWGEIKNTITDPKAYLAAFMFFSCNVAFSSMPVFLPTIIKDMGYDSLRAQARSAPPYLIAFGVVLLTAYASDRARTRSPYLIAHALLSSSAYLAIAATGYFHEHISSEWSIFIRYICVFPATAGFFSAITLIITWSMDNRVEKEGKGASIAILNIIGQCGPLLGTRLYPESDGPWYVRGMASCSFFMIVVAVLAIVLRTLLQRENRTMAQSEHNGTEDPIEEEEELMGGGRRESIEQAGKQRLLYII